MSFVFQGETNTRKVAQNRDQWHEYFLTCPIESCGYKSKGLGRHDHLRAHLGNIKAVCVYRLSTRDAFISLSSFFPASVHGFDDSNDSKAQKIAQICAVSLRNRVFTVLQTADLDEVFR